MKGSSTLFKALLDRCLARDVVAVCRYIPRQNAQPFFTALVPQVHVCSVCNCVHMYINQPKLVFLPLARMLSEGTVVGLSVCLFVPT